MIDEHQWICVDIDLRVPEVWSILVDGQEADLSKFKQITPAPISTLRLVVLPQPETSVCSQVTLLRSNSLAAIVDATVPVLEVSTPDEDESHSNGQHLKSERPPKKSVESRVTKAK